MCGPALPLGALLSCSQARGTGESPPEVVTKRDALSSPFPRDGKLMWVLPGGADGGIPAPVSGGKARVKCPAVFPLAPQQIP